MLRKFPEDQKRGGVVYGLKFRLFRVNDWIILTHWIETIRSLMLDDLKLNVQTTPPLFGLLEIMERISS